MSYDRRGEPSDYPNYGYVLDFKRRGEPKTIDVQVKTLLDCGVHPERIFCDAVTRRRTFDAGWRSLLKVADRGDQIGIVAIGGHLSDEVTELIWRYEQSLRVLGLGVVALQLYDPEDPPDCEELRRIIHAMRIRSGQARALDEGKKTGRPWALTASQKMQCREMSRNGASLRQIARAFQVSPNTVKKALLPDEC